MVQIKGKNASIAVFLIFLLSIVVLSTVVVKLHGVSWGDSLYWTSCSLTWANCYGTIAIPDTAATRMIAIVDGIATIVIVLVFLYAIGENILGLDLGGLKMENEISHMKNHFIICGYGRVGEHVAEIFTRKGIRFIVIETNKTRIEKLKEIAIPTIEGNATDHKTLEKAGIKRATGIVTTLNTDADNLFVVLSSKELNPSIKVAARARSETSISKLHRAGAEVVVLPEIIGGYEIAKEMLDLNESHENKIVSKVESLLNKK